MAIVTHKGNLGEGSITLESDGNLVDVWIKDWTTSDGVLATHTMTTKTAKKWFQEALKELTKVKPRIERRKVNDVSE